MLKGISPLLSPDLLHALASMGHGDEIVLADGNFPSATHARRLVRLPGVPAPQVLDAVLSVLPLDTFVDDLDEATIERSIAEINEAIRRSAARRA